LNLSSNARTRKKEQRRPIRERAVHPRARNDSFDALFSHSPGATNWTGCASRMIVGVSTVISPTKK
jgi:hypothetical protein